MTDNVIAFPPRKPPFLEVSRERCDGYGFVVKYRDEHYRSMVIWRSKRRSSSLKRAAVQAPAFGLPIVDLTG